MEHKEQYDPEDIDRLLETHDFDELIPEEKAFVLKHIEDKQEYERIRTTRTILHESLQDHERPTPDPRIKQNVLEAFREGKRQRPRIWLNSVLALFAAPRTSPLLRPALGIASVLALGLAGWFTFDALREQQMTQQVAEVTSKTEFEEQVNDKGANDLQAEPGAVTEIPEERSLEIKQEPSSTGGQMTNKATADVGTSDSPWTELEEHGDGYKQQTGAAIRADIVDAIEDDVDTPLEDTRTEDVANFSEEATSKNMVEEEAEIAETAIAPAINLDQASGNDISSEGAPASIAQIETASSSVRRPRLRAKELNKEFVKDGKAPVGSLALTDNTELLGLLNAAW